LKVHKDSFGLHQRWRMVVALEFTVKFTPFS
jgi:hypothetical protein